MLDSEISIEKIPQGWYKTIFFSWVFIWNVSQTTHFSVIQVTVVIPKDSLCHYPSLQLKLALHFYEFSL